MRRDWFKEAADDEFIKTQDEIAAREVAEENKRAMLHKPLVFNEADYPRIASLFDEPEKKW